VTQTFASSPQVIFDTLTADATFSSYIGTYTFEQGNTQIDSITITTPGADLPRLKSQSGLEVIIHDSGDTSRMDWLTNTSEAIITWKVFLIIWQPATGQTMTMAAKRIVEIFSQATSIETVAATDGLGALVQTMVLIPSNSVILI
jgi:hypothetical protein